jgi:hypothetical protein
MRMLYPHANVYLFALWITVPPVPKPASISVNFLGLPIPQNHSWDHAHPCGSQAWFHRIRLQPQHRLSSIPNVSSHSHYREKTRASPNLQATENPPRFVRLCIMHAPVPGSSSSHLRVNCGDLQWTQAATRCRGKLDDYICRRCATMRKLGQYI